MSEDFKAQVAEKYERQLFNHVVVQTKESHNTKGILLNGKC